MKKLIITTLITLIALQFFSCTNKRKINKIQIENSINQIDLKSLEDEIPDWVLWKYMRNNKSFVDIKLPNQSDFYSVELNPDLTLKQNLQDHSGISSPSVVTKTIAFNEFLKLNNIYSVKCDKNNSCKLVTGILLPSIDVLKEEIVDFEYPTLENEIDKNTLNNLNGRVVLYYDLSQKDLDKEKKFKTIYFLKGNWHYSFEWYEI